MTTISFLGMGVMGAPMAMNLVKAGFNVRVWNRSKSSPRLMEAGGAGAKACISIQEAVEGAEIIAVCVGDVPDVEAVLFAEEGVAAHAAPGSLIIDFSTIGPLAAKSIGARLNEKKLGFVDAPVSGGDVGARNGTLTVMAGATDKDFARAKPVFDGVGKKIFHCGPVGSGQAVKLCNQVLCAGHMVALTEAMLLAEQQGLAMEQVVEVCSTGAAGSWALTNLGPMIANGEFQPAFMIEHMLKDLRLTLEAMENLGGRKLPGTVLATDLFKKTAELDDGNGAKLGTQGMIRSYREG